MKAKRVIAALAVLGIVGFAVWHFHTPLLTAVGIDKSDKAKPEAPEKTSDPDRVQVSEAQQKDLDLTIAHAATREIVDSVHVPGTVMFDERLQSHLRPRTKGLVLSLAVQPGDAVHAGQVLATLDASGVLDAKNAVDASQASLVEAVSTAAQANIAYKRAGALLKIGGISQAELERRQVEATKADAAVQTARAKLAMNVAQYQRLAPEPGAVAGASAIVSPIDGVVTSSNVTLGEVVDTTQDAFTVADPKRMIVRASLFGDAIERIKPGDPVAVDTSSKKVKGFSGHIASINASLEPATNAASARIEVENRDNLLKGNMFVTADVMADLDRKGVTIPADAVQQTEQGPVGFVKISSTMFERRLLTLGLQQPDWVEVKSGIASGEPVAVKGSFGLKAMLLKNLLGATD